MPPTLENGQPVEVQRTDIEGGWVYRFYNKSGSNSEEYYISEIRTQNNPRGIPTTEIHIMTPDGISSHGWYDINGSTMLAYNKFMKIRELPTEDNFNYYARIGLRDIVEDIEEFPEENEFDDLPLFKEIET
jgi:hypothetical protein